MQVTRDRALREWVLDETADNMLRNFGSGYPGGEKCSILNSIFFCNYWKLICIMRNLVLFLFIDPETKAWLKQHKHSVFGFPSLVRFSWGTCTPYFKDIVEVLWSVLVDHFLLFEVLF